MSTEESPALSSMATVPGNESRSERLTREIIQYGELAFNPELPFLTRSDNETRFSELISWYETDFFIVNYASFLPI
jgi:hypothetical protein